MIFYLFLAGLAMFSLGAISGFIAAAVLGAGGDEGSDLFPPDDGPWLPGPPDYYDRVLDDGGFVISRSSNVQR